MATPAPTPPGPPDGRGLSAAQAAERLREIGPNELRRAARTPIWRRVLAQFASPLVALLLGSCVIAGALGETADVVAIAAIVVLNAIIGVMQEHRAEQAIFALRSLTAPRATVLRDGHASVVPAAVVVPGDLLLLEQGDLVAADARLVEAHALSTNEAALTGESLPVEKRVGEPAADTPLAERTGDVFMGTAVATGTGRAVVRATGMATEIGHIADLLENAAETTTPLQARLAKVARLLLVLCLGIVAIVAAIGLARGQPWIDVLMSAVSLAVAAVPEGLAAIVTIALAIGVRRLAARKVLVRRLPAVETLGCVTVICTDKTGTLTTGRMAVREVWGPDHDALLAAAASCCEAELGTAERAGAGDPTELALLAAAAARDIHRERIEADFPRISVTPFDSDRKRMSVLRANGVLYVKGAPEVIIERCVEGHAGAGAENARLAARGLRVLAVAVGQGEDESGLTLLGLIGLADPPRAEAVEAVKSAHTAGIRTVMITGDHPTTAAAIAREMGILRDGDQAPELVHARATADDKLKIVRAWKERGAIVAMTGDGVNDAPALREAHIGIAMGQAGTEVTREAADMVLTDDDFASIVAAVREGRGIYENIRKTLVYLLTGNAGELFVMLGASIAGWPLPLLPLHLLWINLVTDGLPALALVTDPTDEDLLQRPPRPPEEPILGRVQWAQVATVGALEAAVALGAYAWALSTHGPAEARHFVFSVVVYSELFRAFAARSGHRLTLELGLLTNARLLAVIVITAAVQTALPQVEVLRALFDLRVMPTAEVLAALALGLVTVSVLEVWKLLRRR